MKGSEEKQIVIYNCSIQTPILVFAGYAAAAKELFPKESKQIQTKRIRYASQHKRRLMCEVLGFEIAIRPASEAQIALLGIKEFIKL